MIWIARTPLRLTLGGGGTDSPEYVRENGGQCITAAINKYVTVIVSPTFDAPYRIKYSTVEDVEDIDAVKHPIIREALRFYEVPPRTEILSLADIPSGTGLGSSGAFTVSLCHALSRYVGLYLDRRTLAEHAAQIELEILGRGGGKQDAYACALGDLNVLTFNQDGTVDDSPLFVTPDVYEELEVRLRLFFTGYSRDSDAILRTQTQQGLDSIKASGEISKKCLESGDLTRFGQLLDEHWRVKRLRSHIMSNDHIDAAHDAALASGAIGAKMVGAGGGGFLMCLERPEAHDALTAAMVAQGLREVKFRFDGEGTSVSCSA